MKMTLKKTWYRRVIEIDGLQMWLQKWSPDFKPEEDLPTALAWVLLPGLPFHLHTWQYLKQIVSHVGIPLTLDVATANKTRPSMAKVRVEMDLRKPQIDQVWIGMEYEDSPLKGFYQNIEYEGAPKYCKHCKNLGHNVLECRVLERMNQKKEQEKIVKAKDRVEEIGTILDGNKKNTQIMNGENDKKKKKGDNDKQHDKKDINKENDEAQQQTGQKKETIGTDPKTQMIEKEKDQEGTTKRRFKNKAKKKTEKKIPKKEE
ncbi:uncharacterized protein LOC132624351 [Lycium barbarum]|uniref:uncharacterized protein LOC132624351 n=1 Tax=Lycium barbarum TaxID=112863 RepID=UPI00293E5019|nr:uncharacterized protein LOC132624351 [Lycium barbarum]